MYPTACDLYQFDGCRLKDEISLAYIDLIM